MNHKRLFFLIVVLSILIAVYFTNSSGLTDEELARLATKEVENGNIWKVQLLLWRGTDINVSDEKGKTLLEVSLESGQFDTAKFLISKSRDVNKKDAHGLTPLCLAVGQQRNRRELPDARDSDGYCNRGTYFYWENEFDRAIEDYSSAIRLSSKNGDAYFWRGRAWAEKGNPKQAVADWKKAIELDWHNALNVHYARRLLKSPDADLDRLIKDTAEKHLEDLDVVSGSAVGYAASPGEFHTVSLIISSPFDEEKFLQMAKSNNPVVRAMAMICLARQDKAKYEETIRSFYTDTAEVDYMPGGCMISTITLDKLAKSIIDDPKVLDCWAAAHTDWKSRPSESNAEREDAIKQQMSVIQTLIAHGAGVNVKDQHSQTPLHYAAENGGARVAELLIANGADVNAKNDKGETPLHIATFWGDRQMVELLVSQGADLNAKDNGGQTALDVATQQDYPGLITMLREFRQKNIEGVK